MHYILLILLESQTNVSWRVKGLNSHELKQLQCLLDSLSVMHNTSSDFMEIDQPGIGILNTLAGPPYKVCGQSMIIEKVVIGGRTVQTQKIAWTLGKEE